MIHQKGSGRKERDRALEKERERESRASETEGKEGRETKCGKRL